MQCLSYRSLATDMQPSCPVGFLHPSKAQLFLGGHASGGGSATIQSYDLDVDQQTTRLEVGDVTRIKTTGAEKRMVRDPLVTMGAVSSNGLWLATVDEWVFEYGSDDVVGVETFLKFWRWKQKGWILMTKIESPHGNNGRILGLASRSEESVVQEFATLGSEGCVRIWRSADQSINDTVNVAWVPTHTIGISTAKAQLQGAIKYSQDNSALIVGIAETIYVLNASTGQIQFQIHVGLPITKLASLDKYVVCLLGESTTLSAWDLATGTHVYSERLSRPASLFAVNHATSTFAITSSSPPDNTTILISKLVGHDKIERKRILIQSLVTCLVGSEHPAHLGYIFVEASGYAGRISTITNGSLPIMGELSSSISGSTYAKVQTPVHMKVIRSSGGTGGRRADLSPVFEDEKMDMTQMYEMVVENLY